MIHQSKSTLLLSLLLFVTVPLGCGGESSGAEVWRFALEEPLGSVQSAFAQEFKRRIEERADGAIEVRIFPFGTLGTSDDLTEQVRMGSLQFAMASPGHLGKTIPAVQAFLLHFLFSDDDEINRKALADPAVHAVLTPLYRDKGMHFLCAFPEGWMVWTTRKPVRAPEDFEGVKIRTMTSSLLLDTYAAYGASPQAMPYSEVYGALQLNMIDAQENPIFAIEEMSFYEVTSHLVFGRHAPFVTTVVASPSFYESLPEERRRLLDEVVGELLPFIFEQQRAYNAERLERILERKPEMVRITLTDEERERFRRRSLGVRERFLEETGEAGRRVLEGIREAIERHSRAAAASDAVEGSSD